MKKQITFKKLKTIVWTCILGGVTFSTLLGLFYPTQTIYQSIGYWITGIGVGIALAQGYEVKK